MTAEINQETGTGSDTDTLTDISRSVDFGDLGPIQRLLNISDGEEKISFASLKNEKKSI